MSTTPGPWQRKSIPGHLFEIHNAAGEVVLRIRGGMLPTLGDAQLLSEAPTMHAALAEALNHLDGIGAPPDKAVLRALLARIDGKVDQR